MPSYENINNARDRAFFGDPTLKLTCPNCQTKITRELRPICNVFFDRGARWAVARTASLSPHIAKLLELLIWLYQGDQDEIMNSKTTAELESISNGET